jgi:hypothetical protein
LPSTIEYPTAKHRFAVGHATDVSTLMEAPARFGLDMSDQTLPIRRAITVPPDGFPPTAKQFAGPVHATSWKRLCGGVGGLSTVRHSGLALSAGLATTATLMTNTSAAPRRVNARTRRM